MDCLYCGEFIITINEGGLGEFFICINPSCPELYSMPSDEINANVDKVKKNNRKRLDQKDNNDDDTTAL